MPFADIFKGLFGGDPVKSISGLIDEFHLTPEAKAQLQQAAQDLEVRREEIEAARDQALAQLQSANITAETKSEDSFVRRARPTFLYVIIAAMAYSLIVAPTINACLHKGLVAMQIPDAYLELFGVAFLGYTGARSWEKTKGLD
jgi:Holin of 3TMs, for gene-transfer release